jgi:GNAT superfamily N-acetyltransferase
MNQPLVELCQQHLIAALLARVRSTEQAVGQRFAFEVVQRDNATAFFAHHWPQTSGSLPFHRIFHYRAPSVTASDPLLDRLLGERIDAVIEVLPGAHEPATATLLREYGFSPTWQIPWFYLPLEGMERAPRYTSAIRAVDPSELTGFAALLSTAYGYQNAEKDAWQDLAQHGYRAPGFGCFVATVAEHVAAGGVVHVNETSALVDGAATLPAYRGSGMQKALLAARFWHARQRGARHAFSRTGAGSVSQRNLANAGMRLLVQSTAWRRT